MENTFAEKLISWYKNHMRELPWRETNDPYRIWLSEIILQQTRVKQGLPYYEKFVSKYPSVKELAAAPQDEVLRLWQGLGYYSRARNLHACAQMIVNEYAGVFPESYEELQKLKGVGKYTAAAIASFAFKRTVPVVDGNVFRVLSRYLHLENDIADTKTFKVFFEASKELIDAKNPDLYNQAMMELGATLCSVNKPTCLMCPVSEGCLANANGVQERLPVKSKKVKVRNRFFYYLLLEKDEKLLMGKRGPNDIWQGLFDFPMIESNTALSDEQLLEKLSKHASIDEKSLEYIEMSEPIKHVLTHQRIEAKFVHLKTNSLKRMDHYNWYSSEEIENLPKPILVDKYLKGRDY